MYFVDSGWSVLCFDGTAVGSSTGNSSIGLQQMVKDILAAVDFLSSAPETEKLPLVLYGHSMGGYASVIAAEERKEIRAVVSISGFESPMELMLNLGKRTVGEAAYIGYPFLYLQNIMSFGGYANRSAAKAINNSPASFLIVYGSEDAVISEGDSIYGSRAEITNPSAEFLLVDKSPRNSHSAAWLSERAAEYRAEIDVQIKALKEEYGSLLPVDVFSDFYSSLDFDSLFELDEDFMEKVLQFYMAAK